MVPVSKTLCGGDLPCAYSKCFSTDKSSLDYALDWYRKAWIKPIESANVDLYTARGNHDFTVRHDVDSDEGYTLSALTTRDFIMGTRAVVRNAVVNKADPEAICYFFDNAAAGIRYIVADTTDSMTSVRSYWSRGCAISSLNGSPASRSRRCLPAGRWSSCSTYPLRAVRRGGGPPKYTRLSKS